MGPAHGMSEMWSAALAAGHREDVGRVVLVAREDRRDDLRVVLVALGEERTARAVDEARGEDLVVALPPLALEEAAGDLPGGERLLDVVAGEGEEIDARAARRR